MTDDERWLAETVRKRALAACKASDAAGASDRARQWAQIVALASRMLCDEADHLCVPVAVAT